MSIQLIDFSELEDPHILLRNNPHIILTPLHQTLDLELPAVLCQLYIIHNYESVDNVARIQGLYFTVQVLNRRLH